MAQKKKGSISRKDAIKQLGGLVLGIPLSFPLTSHAFRSSSILKSDIWKVDQFKDFPPLFPFQISHDSSENITNFKHLLNAPAGKDGFIKVKDGRFINKSGQVRLNGVNLTGPANFPSHKDAERLGDRLARFGINCVRLHYTDAYYGNFLQKKEQGLIADDPNTQRNLDPHQLDRYDYLIAAFKERGIYVDINLHVARWWDDRDGFPFQEYTPPFDKGLDNFEPRMIELQKEYARKLLTHVNVYTSLPYTDEPAVASIELNNENSLISEYFNGSIDRLPDPYASEFRKQWNRWLKNKYGTTKKIKEVWESVPLKWEKGNNSENSEKLQKLLANGNQIEDYTIPTIEEGRIVLPTAKRDFFQFMMDTENAYWTGMYNYLKNNLKVKPLVYGTQVGYHGTPFIQAKLDFVDHHDYWCHPGPVNPEWRMVNISMVNSMSRIKRLATQRVVGKPHTVSEYNHPFPNQYGAEGQPMLRAYGSFQGWSGVYEYTYNDRTNFDPTFNNYFFSIIERTDVLAHFPACSAIYLRGDVHEGKSTVIGAMDYKTYFNSLINTNSVRGDFKTIGLDRKLCLIHKTGIDLSGKSGVKKDDIIDVNKSVEGKVLVSDTGELTWNIEDPQSGFFTVNTSNCKLFTGFPKDRKILFGDISLSVGKTRLGWATISMVSKNGNGFGERGNPAKILVAATGIIKNSGMNIIKGSNDRIWLSNWGEGPVYAEGIPATIALPITSDRIKVFALDITGNRMTKIPIDKSNKNETKIIIKPEYRTVWYEISID